MLAAWSKSALVEHDVIRETGMPRIERSRWRPPPPGEPLVLCL